MNQSDKRNSWKRLITLIIPYIFIVGLFQYVGTVVSEAYIDNKVIAAASTEQQLIISFFTLLGTFLLLFLFMKYIDKEPFLNLGFQYKNKGKDIFIGLLIGLLIMGFGYLILVSFNQIKFISITFFYSDFLIVFVIFLSVAFAEEALFRGYILRNLINSMNKNMALLVSAIIFTAMHALNQNITFIGLVSLFLAGILLGLPYIYTKNLWFPISLHFSWNFFQSLLGFNVSGKNSYSIVNFDLVEKNNLNGGDFGFEGSVLSVLALTGLIILTMYYFNRYGNENKKTIFN